MRRALLFGLLLFCCSQVFSQSKKIIDYYPPRGEWVHRSPSALGLDSGALAAAIQFARDNESKAPRDQALAQAESLGKAEPYDEVLCPVMTWSVPTGLIA